jgi:hypothetical protein
VVTGLSVHIHLRVPAASASGADEDGERRAPSVPRDNGNASSESTKSVFLSVCLSLSLSLSPFCPPTPPLSLPRLIKAQRRVLARNKATRRGDTGRRTTTTTTKTTTTTTTGGGRRGRSVEDAVERWWGGREDIHMRATKAELNGVRVRVRVSKAAAKKGKERDTGEKRRWNK